MDERLVFDLGMNDGEDTAYYLHCGYRVVAVEANKFLAQQGEQRFAKEIAESRLTILNLGIADREGVLDFWVCDDQLKWSSFDQAMASVNGSRHHCEPVQTKTYPYLVERFGVPYYLKIDIEGQEHSCLERLGDDLPQYVSMEAYSEDDLIALDKAGYRQFKCISQYYYLSLEDEPEAEEVRLRALLGANRTVLNRMKLRSLRKSLVKFDGWRFTMGSTGPLGELTRGQWKSLDDMLRLFRKIKAEADRGEHVGVHRSSQPNSFWIDFHAKR